MASLIHGYNYDIFISYRQKDNRGERWVSEFVEALKSELESTFKEDISIYFDENPHDGLLETHDVDASLKEKLNCLIFIPIISRTYCDPKSFAWEHEFMAFIEKASKDEHGLKVKLLNGNVSNRVLPIQIHELDPADKSFLESVLGGFIRGIEFIYKEPGVNKPLTPRADEKKNQNNTKYEIQVNKVANAIKEIITGIKNPLIETKLNSKEIIRGKPLFGKMFRMISGVSLVLALAVAGYFIVPKVLKPKEQKIEKSIAVLPFKLMSDEPDKQYLADGMMDAITLHLSRIKVLHVLGRTSVEQYRETKKTITQIAKELGVEYLLEGSFQKFGNNTKLIVKLIKASEGSHIWGNEYNSKWNEVFSLQSEVAQTIARELGAAITPEEKQIIEKIPTTSLTAYDLYQQFLEVIYRNQWTDNPITLRKMEELLKKALEYDSTFARAYVGLAGVYTLKHWNAPESYFNENYLDSTVVLLDKAFSYDAHLDDAYWQRALYYNNTGQPEKAIIEFDKAIKYNPNHWEAYRRMGSWVYLSSLYYSDFVKGLECLHKAVSLNHSGERISILHALADAYTYQAGFPEVGKKYYNEAFKLHKDTMVYLAYIGRLEIQYGDFNKGIEKLLKVNARYSINTWLAEKYFFNGEYGEALKYYKKYLEGLESPGSFLMRNQNKIAYAYWQNGYKKEADYWFAEQLSLSQAAIKLGRYYSTSFDPNNAYYDLAGVYAFRGEKDKALEILGKFDYSAVLSKRIVDDLKYNPLFNGIRKEPEFKRIVKACESKYQAEHERVRKWLEEKEILRKYIYPQPLLK